MSPSGSNSGRRGKTINSRENRRQDARQNVALANATEGIESENGRGESLDDTRKDLLISEKEAELTRIYEGHDSLVREAFHMEHFRMMLSYDPDEAKQDNSAVFQNYKSSYDLLEAASLSIPGPSRKTRRAHIERKSLVLPGSFDTSTTASMTAPISSGRKVKTLSNHHTSDSRFAPRLSSLSQDAGSSSTHAKSSEANGKKRSMNATQDVRSRSPARGSKSRKRFKRDTADSGTVDVDDGNAYMDLATAITRTHSDTFGISTPLPKRSSGIRLRVPARKSMTIPTPDSISIVECHPVRSQNKVSSLSTRSTAELSSPFPSLPSPTSKSLQWPGPITQSELVRPSLAVPPQSPASKLNGHTTKNKMVSANDEQRTRFLSSLLPVESVASLQPSRSPIRRIKLVVRPPVPLITSHLQKPLPPKHNYSLSGFLSSYTTDGFEEVLPDILAERARTRAKFLERTRMLREGSRPLNDFSVLAKTSTEAANERRKSSDIWYHCIEDAAAYLEAKSEEPSGAEIAGHISKAIQAYWDVQSVKREKMKAQEEKRIRVLAKATIKLVTAEWKKAVFHLREQERLKLEAEEVRRGRAHLDAILDQSGHILETQHGDLTRTDRSRSQSRGSSVSCWTENEDHDHDGDSQEEDEEEEEEDPGVDDSVISQDEGEAERKEGASRMSLEGKSAGSQQASDISNLHEPFLGLSQSPAPSIPLVSPASVHNSPSDTRKLLPLVNDLTPCTPLDLDQSSDNCTSSPITVHPSLQGNGLMSAPATLLDKANTIELDLEGPSTVTEVDNIIVDNQPLSPSNSTSTFLNGNGDSIKYFSLRAQSEEDSDDSAQTDQIPAYLKPFAVTHVEWNPDTKIALPVLLRGVLRPYQFAGLEWLASLHSNNLNGILADEMGLGKTIQTISLLAHLACDRGIWGPHLIIVPTSVLLNWEMEFKKFLPGFKVLCYHGTAKRRKELRQGWNDKYHFNNWYYMVLDEAHMIKNFRSQRWNTLLLFRSFRRLLLTGTPLQNNLTELWALLQFLMSGAKFANLKEFGEWFSNPLERAIEMGNVHDDETKQRVIKLHTVLRPYLLRRLKRDVEKELPNKYEHLVLCSLSKRQRFLYDEFMARAHTRDALQSGVYQKIANILMQLRKVCNHPDLFEVRPVVTSFVMDRSAIADFEIKELLIRRRLLNDEREDLDLELLGLSFVHLQNISKFNTLETQAEVAGAMMMRLWEDPGLAPPRDVRTIKGFRKYSEWQRRASLAARWSHIAYINRLRYTRSPIYSSETISLVRSMYSPIIPLSHVNTRTAEYVDNVLPSVHRAVLSYQERSDEMADVIERFAFITPSAVARDVSRFTLAGLSPSVLESVPLAFDEVIRRSAVKLSIAFPSPSLLQYDCGKLQRLTTLLREKKAGGHRVLLFTQMTKILDILEIYLNFHGYLYLRLDGATSIEDRQYVTERFNKDEKIFCFIASSRSGGVGINLTGADTVIFYDSDFNPQMDRQCEDRAHRIGQIRDVHIYRFVSEHTVEEAMLLKANQKRFLDDMVIQKGEFDWRSIFKFDSNETTNIAVNGIDSGLLTKALGEFEDSEDALAARMAEREEVDMEGADEADFGLGAIGEDEKEEEHHTETLAVSEEDEEDGGTTVEYMLAFINRDPQFFAEWRL